MAVLKLDLGKKEIQLLQAILFSASDENWTPTGTKKALVIFGEEILAEIKTQCPDLLAPRELGEF